MIANNTKVFAESVDKSFMGQFYKLILCSFMLSNLLLAQQIARECKPNKDPADEKMTLKMNNPSDSNYTSCIDENCTTTNEIENNTNSQKEFSCSSPCEGNICSGFCTIHRPDHKGIDYAVRYGPVFAAHDGIVKDCRTKNIYPEGRYIIIETLDEQYQTHYYHLSQINKLICGKDAQGKVIQTPISRGAYIATSGNTGESSGPHLHFTVKKCKWDKRINTYGFVPINPLPFICQSMVDDVADSPNTAESDIENQKRCQNYKINKCQKLALDYSKDRTNNKFNIVCDKQIDHKKGFVFKSSK